MITLIIIIILCTILWFVGMGITARFWDDYDEGDIFVLFLLWWIILIFITLANLFEVVSGK